MKSSKILEIVSNSDGEIEEKSKASTSLGAEERLAAPSSTA
jgi:hypothetical protein